MSFESPLVSIGIPTYNSEKTIEKTLIKILEQNYKNIEIIISDDGSSDNTKKILKKFNNDKIKLFFQNYNIGSTENFKFVLSQANGSYFMWHAHDDWFDKKFLEKSLKYLQENNDYILVSGNPIFLDDGVELKITNKYLQKFDDDDPYKRVAQYLSFVEDNSIFYGLTKTNVLRSIKFDHFLGNDWMIVVGLLYQGKALQIRNSKFYRNVGGTGKSFKSIVETFKLNKFTQYFPYIMMSYYFIVNVFSSKCFSNNSILLNIKLIFILLYTLHKRILSRRTLKIVKKIF